ncbi:MAG: PDZ domain-containing protein [Akkermansiaceae bacterium]
MNFSFPLSLLLLASLSASAYAQRSVRLSDPFANLTQAEKITLQEQAVDIFSTLKTAIADSSQSSVSISNMRRRIAFGTIVASPKDQKPLIVTKWSEIASSRNNLIVTTSTNKSYMARITGVYPEHDLALLSIAAPEEKLSALNLTDAVKPQLGDFVTLVRHDARAEGFGVISVNSRNIQESGKGYLGVQMNPNLNSTQGIALTSVVKDSPASKAGLVAGDTVISIEGKQLNNYVEMRHFLQKLNPGSEINLSFKRGEKLQKTTVTLGSRADNDMIQSIPTKRMNQMEGMGKELSAVRSDFPNVIQTDMPIEPNDVGSPAVNLDGDMIGIAIASASRIKTYIIPANEIYQVLQTKPQSLRQVLYSRN